ncbi:MAG: hypothetical protein Q3966_06715 [Neisseria sp.]|nr:hypothetical protein [Neisseria sp.]
MRYSKYASLAPACPTCGRPCDDLGDRRPVPPHHKIKDWRRLEQDYRALQRKIAQAYVRWKQCVRSDLQRHLLLAKAAAYEDIVADDLFWLKLTDELDELPYAYYVPFACNWTALVRPEASVSNIDGKHPDTEAGQRLRHLQSLPRNKERQTLIDELVYCQRSLKIYDSFHQIRHQFYIVREGSKQYFHEYGKQKCFKKNLMIPFL